MSAQRKLLSVLRPRTRLLAFPTPTSAATAAARSRSIFTSSTLFRPTAAENVAESGSKEESKTVPSEQITEEAKAAEPDAEEQVEKVSLSDLLLGAGSMTMLIDRWRRREWTPSPLRLRMLGRSKA
jgi:hypothetical protein